MTANLDLLNANGSFGLSSYGSPIFPTVRDFLAHMDRFGVARSVLWNIETRDANCPWCNRRTWDEIQRTPGAKERVIPAFTVSPVMIYEHGAVEGLKQLMTESGSSAIRFVRGMSNFTFNQLEPLFREIQPLKPVVFAANGDVDATDVLEFTQKFPEIPVILGAVAWGHYGFVFNLMRQRKNILIETSYMHTWRAIELAAREFGADRVIFGMGDKAHNGAAIAAMAEADIPLEQREMIAHGNIERLLRIKPAKVTCGNASKKALWSRLLAGEPTGVDTIDAHGHLGPSGGYVVDYHDIKDQVPDALRKMDKVGIRTLIVSGMQPLFSDPLEGNRQLEQELTPHGDRFAGYFVFNPYYTDRLAPTLDESFSRRFFVGFKTLCDYWRVPVTDSRFEPMWRFAHEHRLPILYHTWDGPYDSPALLKDIVRRYPQAIFLLGHSGGGDGGRREAVDLAINNDNVYLEWCGSFCSSIPWEDTLPKVGNHKVVFGTDAAFHGFAWELGRLLSVDVPDDTLIPILGANMRKILAKRI